MGTNVNWKGDKGDKGDIDGIGGDQAARTDERAPSIPAPECVEYRQRGFRTQKHSPGAEAPSVTVVYRTRIPL
jgi:hypothetical protein